MGRESGLPSASRKIRSRRQAVITRAARLYLSVLALSSAVLGALMVDHDYSLWAAIPFCVLSGAACGLFNGTVSVLAGIPSFIVTLGMLEIARGATKVVTNSETKYIGSAVEVIGEPITGILLSPAFLLAVAIK